MLSNQNFCNIAVNNFYMKKLKKAILWVAIELHLRLSEYIETMYKTPWGEQFILDRYLEGDEFIFDEDGIYEKEDLGQILHPLQEIEELAKEFDYFEIASLALKTRREEEAL